MCKWDKFWDRSITNLWPSFKHHNCYPLKSKWLRTSNFLLFQNLDLGPQMLKHSAASLVSIEVQTEENSLKTCNSHKKSGQNKYPAHLYFTQSLSGPASEEPPSPSSTSNDMVFSGTDRLSDSKAESDSDALSPFHSRNFVVNESQLDKLFHLYCTCGQPIIEKKKNKLIKGSMSGRTHKRDTQPCVNEMPPQMVSKSHFYSTQDLYVFAVAHNTWYMKPENNFHRGVWHLDTIINEVLLEITKHFINMNKIEIVQCIIQTVKHPKL